MSVGCARKMSRAVRQSAVISAFFRHSDLLTLPVYPTSSSLWIMSSMSNCFSLSLPPPLFTEEVPVSDCGKLSAAEAGVEVPKLLLAFDRIVLEAGMSRGGRVDFLYDTKSVKDAQ